MKKATEIIRIPVEGAKELLVNTPPKHASGSSLRSAGPVPEMNPPGGIYLASDGIEVPSLEAYDSIAGRVAGTTGPQAQQIRDMIAGLEVHPSEVALTFVATVGALPPLVVANGVVVDTPLLTSGALAGACYRSMLAALIDSDSARTSGLYRP